MVDPDFACPLIDKLKCLNWKDFYQNGSCYQINESVFNTYDNYSNPEEEIVFNKYQKPLEINQYDEIHTNVTLFKPPRITMPRQRDRLFTDYHQWDVLIERNCTGSLSVGSFTRMNYLVELV